MTNDDKPPQNVKFGPGLYHKKTRGNFTKKQRLENAVFDEYVKGIIAKREGKGEQPNVVKHLPKQEELSGIQSMKTAKEEAEAKARREYLQKLARRQTEDD